jgi:hypothetical protein
VVVNPIMAAWLNKGGLWSIRAKWSRRYLCRVKVVVDQSLGMVEYKLADNKNRALQ